MKLLSLFSGIGAFEKALDRLGVEYDLVNYCEIDRYASKAYSLIHGVPENLNLGDITKVDGDSLPKDIDLLTYGFPCVPKGYLVRTSFGFKPIETIDAGELVLTHRNRFRKVLKTMNRVGDHIYHIKAVGAADLELTGEHPVYSFQNGCFSWIKTKYLKPGDYVVYNINNREVPSDFTSDQLWLMGRYVADGYRENHSLHRVLYAIGDSKNDEFIRHLGDRKEGVDYVVRHRNGSYEYKMFDSFLENVLLQFGFKSLGKIIPNWVLELDCNQLSAFLDGYLSGDGHSRKDRKLQMYSTVNRNVGVSIQDIIIKLHRVVPTMSIRKDFRKPTFNDSYNYQYSLNPIDQQIIGDKILVKIKSITREDKPIEVFNLEVEEDNSYCVENVIVHNCQDISIAGNCKGFEYEGKITRSGLFFDALRIIEAVKPRCAIAENVKNLTSDSFKEEFTTVLDCLDKAGYDNYHAVLNAKDFGVPQNRERVFIVSIRRDVNDDCFGFPKGFPLERRLKDVLESNVDEKYYLSDDAVNVMVQHRLRNEAKGNGFGAKFMDGDEVCSTLVTGSYKSNSPYLKVRQISNVRPSSTRENPNQGRVYDSSGLSPTLGCMEGGSRQPFIIASRGRGDKGSTKQSFEANLQGTSNALTSVQKDNYLCEPIALDEQNGYLWKDGCVGTLTTDGSTPKHNNRVVQMDYRIRKLTPKECFRLMGFDDADVDVLVSNGISDSQLYKMAGNSIVVDVLVALLRNVLRCDGCDVFEPSGSLF